MKINVAGAGAGKTTLMANLITEYDIPDGKMVFCIAFTNAAVDIIKEKVEKKLGKIPSNIIISTIHSFLFQELINPYYYILYGKHFERLSAIKLPDNEGFKRAKLSALDNNNILHITKIPEKAKWVAFQKSGDGKAIKDLRKILLNRFSNYCAAIFVDEAQDINEDIRRILDVLEKEGIDINLYGDPKQDVKGLNQFRTIVNNTKDVNYISVCHRCPQKHLNISNTLAVDAEQQIADEDNKEGSINVVFESDIVSIRDFIQDGGFGLKYISMKRERFATHEKKDNIGRFETLWHEVHRAMSKKWNLQKSDLEINRESFFVTEQMLKAYGRQMDKNKIISQFVRAEVFDRLDKKSFAQMASAICEGDDTENNVPVVSSIESIKGLESERCLFILTPDLAPYLFHKKTIDNKTSHLLYVALTRSLNHLTIMVIQEVEAVFGRAFITKFFE